MCIGRIRCKEGALWLSAQPCSCRRRAGRYLQLSQWHNPFDISTSQWIWCGSIHLALKAHLECNTQCTTWAMHAILADPLKQRPYIVQLLVEKGQPLNKQSPTSRIRFLANLKTCVPLVSPSSPSSPLLPPWLTPLPCFCFFRARLLLQLTIPSSSPPPTPSPATVSLILLFFPFFLFLAFPPSSSLSSSSSFPSRTLLVIFFFPSSSPCPCPCPAPSSTSSKTTLCPSHFPVHACKYVGCVCMCAHTFYACMQI